MAVTIQQAATLCPRPKVDRQRLALGGSVDYGVVHINYAVTWTSNQSGLWPWPLTFWSWKWSPSHGYLCANFSLPKPLCSRLRPDVRDRQTDRQTDVRQHHCL